MISKGDKQIPKRVVLKTISYYQIIKLANLSDEKILEADAEQAGLW